ncbi:hypothetical protein [Paraburkholderia sp. J41]|uniref:hypothetical protein n=1 Tax=Paraburkholderia sp. J41 TaxID=2805433 RepID=UPI002AC35C44|nr:hypothetical protein [Paraburkholderia sp. J41]
MGFVDYLRRWIRRSMIRAARQKATAPASHFKRFMRLMRFMRFMRFMRRSA